MSVTTERIIETLEEAAAATHIATPPDEIDRERLLAATTRINEWCAGSEPDQWGLCQHCGHIYSFGGEPHKGCPWFMVTTVAQVMRSVGRCAKWWLRKVRVQA